ncbi:MAG TPA: hypothetical protein VGE12_06625 [Noviherbaspirillum sp.]
MKFSRQSRVITALFALVTVLFMQLAVSAYACPSLAQGQTVAMTLADIQVVDHESMVGCEGVVDAEQPSLCFVHSQYGDQSSGTAEPPSPAPSIMVVAMPVIRPSAIPQRSPGDYLITSVHARETTPPLTIQNCCFRI